MWQKYVVFRVFLVAFDTANHVSSDKYLCYIPNLNTQIRHPVQSSRMKSYLPLRLYLPSLPMFLPHYHISACLLYQSGCVK